MGRLMKFELIREIRIIVQVFLVGDMVTHVEVIERRIIQ